MLSNWYNEYFSRVIRGTYNPANVVDFFNKFYENYPHVKRPPVEYGPPAFIIGLGILAAFIYSASQEDYNAGMNIIFALGIFATLMPGFFLSLVYPSVYIRFIIARKRLKKMTDCSHEFITENGDEYCSNCKYI
ncbi:MAG: hypothetical protein HeimC3_12840 [Candidatus Heimdallarchaeota archaeon LC_3]|nr:MAG: hypothetical protein HeimC3_12840 [Candidatus Heimdallarchaeota archaeon LC_3]